jgi:hypothetical protein
MLKAIVLLLSVATCALILIAFWGLLAWTPSLIILAASLWDVPELEGMD